MNVTKERLENIEIPTRYNMKADEWLELWHMAKNDSPEAIILAFNYGFLRGQNYQKNSSRRKNH